MQRSAGSLFLVVPSMRGVLSTLALFACFLAGAPGTAPGDSGFQGVRLGDHGADSVRVVFDLKSKTGIATTRVLDSEDWIVRFEGLCPGASLPKLRDPHPLLRGVQGSCDGADLLVRLQARRPLALKSFLLPGGGGKPWRLVVDLGIAASQPGKSPPPSGAPADAEPAPRRKGPWRILVDPGHGGHDPGAQGKGIQEKEVVLDVARRVTRMLNATPGFEAHMTRQDDRFIGLKQRRRMGEEKEADAFVSIHVNAARASQAGGVEVYFLSIGGASDEASRELARLENEADPDYVVEEDSLLEGIPFGFDLRQSDTLMRSSHLAEAILVSLERSELAASRGVKQAGFAVLKSFQVPSILVEIGFLSNPAEAKRLKDDEHRERLAGCIASGATNYFSKYARARAETSEGAP